MKTKDEINQKLGATLGRDPGAPDGWMQIVCVIRVGRGTVGGWSKAYLNGEDTRNFYTQDDTIPFLAQKLRDVMVDENGDTWVACKITLMRETAGINIQFEYDDPRTWDTPLPF